jgi:hypothetical protein
MEHSRASTTRLQPSSRANSIPAALVMVICVEAWIGKSGESRRISRQMPTSCTITASTPAAIIVRRYFSASASSFSKTSVFSVT